MCKQSSTKHIKHLYHGGEEVTTNIKIFTYKALIPWGRGGHYQYKDIYIYRHITGISRRFQLYDWVIIFSALIYQWVGKPYSHIPNISRYTHKVLIPRKLGGGGCCWVTSYIKVSTFTDALLEWVNYFRGQTYDRVFQLQYINGWRI